MENKEVESFFEFHDLFAGRLIDHAKIRLKAISKQGRTFIIGESKEDEEEGSNEPKEV